MNENLILLSVLQALNLLVYRWVQSNFSANPLLRPAIFHNVIARNLLIIGPNAIGLILVVLAFLLTDSPWLFLGLSVVGFIAFATTR